MMSDCIGGGDERAINLHCKHPSHMGIKRKETCCCCGTGTGRVVLTEERTPENGYHGAECRGCGRKLRGYPYHMGKPAYLPLDEGGGQAKVNHYGGFVCSYHCDYRSALCLEQTMPGHGGQERLMPPLSTRIAERWEA